MTEKKNAPMEGVFVEEVIKNVDVGALPMQVGDDGKPFYPRPEDHFTEPQKVAKKIAKQISMLKVALGKASADDALKLTQQFVLESQKLHDELDKLVKDKSQRDQLKAWALL